MYIQRPPKWLWENYCCLWHKKGKQEFEFEEALAILKISRQMLLKTLSELEKRGLLIKWRSEYERRIKKYRIIPKEVIELIENYTLSEHKEKNKLNFSEKLRLMTKVLQEQKECQMRYLITGSITAYYYHKYIIPPNVFELKILDDDMDKWVFFLTDKDTRVYGWTEKQTIEIPSNEKHKFVIKLCQGLNEEEYNRKHKENNLFYQSKEDLIFDLIKKRTRLGVIEAIAIMLTNKINWEQLIKIFEKNPLQKELGAILDILYNKNKRLVEKKIIQKLEKYKQGKRFELFPADIKEECNDYRGLSEKWNLSIVLSKHDIKKMLEDLRYGRK